MRTRAARLSVDHVGALNLIQLVFDKETKVIEAYKNYRIHLSMSPRPDRFLDPAFYDTEEGLFLDLLSAIASALDYDFDKKDLESLSYFPQGWGDDELRRHQITRSLADMLSGKGGSFPISVVNPPREQ